ncbi:hypothetical protein [Streptomyces odontomachi]|uniref:hypothetical protein n=1 Tax=Streptomyces odontomachi TaxID=2944940 RepID=UPI00210D7C5E|nr:hypothetical protein [Streptomyces sp. ODS25]
MYGPGYAPPQPRRPPTARLILLRVVFVTLAMGCIGFLAWAALLRVAVVTRKKHDWAVFWTGLVTVVAGTVFLMSDPTEEISTWRGYLGMALLLVSAIGSTAYYLYADIRHYDAREYPAHPGPLPAGGAAATGYLPHAAYGYPQQGSGGTVPGPVGTAVPNSGPSVGQHTMPYPASLGQPPNPYAATSPMQGGPHTPPPVNNGPGPVSTPYPPPVTPAPQSGHGRIDQVRAELDELSDYLRRQGDDAQHPGQAGPPAAGEPGNTWGPEGGR